MEDDEVMMASEPAVATYPRTSYQDVMRYLHTIRLSPEDKKLVAHRLTLEVTGKNLSRVYSRLDYLASLEKDWDGEGGLPVSRRVLDNIKRTLLISDDSDWQGWLIGADANATLGLQSKTTKACISIGAKEYSYFARKDGNRFGESHVDFTPEALLNTMREIG